MITNVFKHNGILINIAGLYVIMRDFILIMRDFILIMRDFILIMRDFILIMRDFISILRDFRRFFKPAFEDEKKYFFKFWERSIPSDYFRYTVSEGISSKRAKRHRWHDRQVSY